MPPKVSEYMSSPVIAANPSDNLAHVRRLMIRHDIGCIVVVDSEGKPLGIITKRDFIKIAVDRNLSTRPLDTILARELLNTKFPILDPNDNIVDAARILLRERSHYGIVVSEGRVQGILSSTDLVRAYAERYEGKARVRDYMSHEVPVADRTHTIHYVAELMSQSKHCRVIIVDGDKPIGIITETDLAFMEVPRRTEDKPYRKSVGQTPRGHVGVLRFYTIPLAEDLMTSDLITINADEDLASAARIIVDEGIGGLPVVDSEGKLIGLITRVEILKALSEM